MWLMKETRSKENLPLTFELWSSQVVIPRWKPEAGLKSPDVRLPGSLHLWPTSSHWRAFPAGIGNCTHNWALSNCSLLSSCPFFFFFCSSIFFVFLCAVCPSLTGRFFFLFSYLEASLAQFLLWQQFTSLTTLVPPHLCSLGLINM